MWPPDTKSRKLRPDGPHIIEGSEHKQEGPFGDCLLCRLEAVARAWFEWNQQALDELLAPYRRADDE